MTGRDYALSMNLEIENSCIHRTLAIMRTQRDSHAIFFEVRQRHLVGFDTVGVDDAAVQLHRLAFDRRTELRSAVTFSAIAEELARVLKGLRTCAAIQIDESHMTAGTGVETDHLARFLHWWKAARARGYALREERKIASIGK